LKVNSKKLKVLDKLINATFARKSLKAAYERLKLHSTDFVKAQNFHKTLKH
jgi:hypothetical protein